MDKEAILTNFLTILIALIAAFIALYQVKANIISNARMNWIEKLRTSLSSFCVESANCGIIMSNIGNYVNLHLRDNEKENFEDEVRNIILKHYPDYFNASAKVDNLCYEILLFLDSNDKNQKELENLVVAVCSSLRNPNFLELDRKELTTRINNIIYHSKIVFKNEWKKSKRLFKL